MQERSLSIGGYSGNMININTNVEAVGGAELDDENKINTENVIEKDDSLQQIVPEKESPLVMSRELDRLLAKAAIQSYAIVSKQNIEEVKSAVRLSSGEKKELKNAFEGMQAAMQRVNSLKGNAFGTVFIEGSETNKIVQAAIEKQFDLANKLHAIAEKAASDEIRMKLDGMAQLCEMRASEISRLAGELADLADAYKSGGERDARLDRSVKEMIPLMAAKMHGTEEALQHLENYMKTLFMRIDSYREHPESKQLDIEGLKRDINRMKEALLYAGKYGIDMSKAYDTEKSLQDGGVMDKKQGRLLVDPFIIGNMIDLLDGALKRVNNCFQAIRAQHLKNFVEMEFPKSPFDKYLQFMIDCEDMGYDFNSVEKDRLRQIREMVALFNDFRKTAKQYAAQPSSDMLRELEGKLQRIQMKASSLSGVRTVMKDMLERFVNKTDSASKQKKYMELRLQAGDLANEKKLDELVKFYNEKGMMGLKRVFGHMLFMEKCILQNEKSLEKLMTSQDLAAVYDGELEFSSLVEGRIHGMQEGDMDPAYDSSKLIGSKQLSHVSYNSVVFCDFRQKDGTVIQSVFKPELAGRNALDFILLGMFGNYGMSQRMYNLNIASYENAKLFGLEENMVKSSAGTFHGQYGFFMEKAPGMSPWEMRKSPKEKKDNGLSAEEINALPKEKKQVCLGNMMHQLSNLQWLDLLNGQGDRHHSNYMLKVDSDMKVTVKGIDNDASFPENRNGVMKYTIPQSKKIDFFMELLNKCRVAFPNDEVPKQPKQEPQAQQAYLRRYGPALIKNYFGCHDGFTFDPNTGLIDSVDLAQIKMDRGLVIAALKRNIGIKNCNYPSVIDRRLMEAFFAMKNSPERMAEWKDQMSKRMSAKSVEATIARFNDICDYLENMDQENILSGDEWHQRDWTPSSENPDLLSDDNIDLDETNAGQVKVINGDISYLMDDFLYRDYAKLLKLK